MVDDEHDDDSMPGQDSFIDVICNMVGILITLVVVVGVRVSQSMFDPSTEATPAAVRPAPPEGAAEVAAELRDARRAWRDAREELARAQVELTDMMVQQDLVSLRRDQLSLIRAQAEQEIARRRAELDEAAQHDFDVQRQIAEAQFRLDQLTQEQLSLITAPEDVEELETVPTPLAKTVSGDEIHVRLRRGQLAVVPVDELLREVERRGGASPRGGLEQRNEGGGGGGAHRGGPPRAALSRPPPRRHGLGRPGHRRGAPRSVQEKGGAGRPAFRRH
ncbi:MAG TPA: hypothetical protein PKC18_03430, partial [Lacipirellulaceae bacterium]|nr:hypothetical protein [Lacipirellulaceae bacterium]